MQSYLCTWRAVADDATIARVDAAGIYWTQGGEVLKGASRRRHHLKVEAESPEDAVKRAQAIIDDAGGESDDVECVGPATDDQPSVASD